MKKTKVLMIGNDSSVKGGITSVITQLMEYDWNNKNIDMKFIPTYVDKNNIQKIFYFIRAYLNIKKEIRKNGTDIIYMHMSYKGSFTRKYLIQKLLLNKYHPYKLPLDKFPTLIPIVHKNDQQIYTIIFLSVLQMSLLQRILYKLISFYIILQ